ncbi:MAG: ATP-binding cassette domain-containing protein [Rhodospirillaceae bacterium]|nr:ATP-binding cassette domain-containing protein [Rhodospirillaceae bacterium]
MSEATAAAPAPSAAAEKPPLLEVQDLARYFRVAAPWIERVLGRQQVRLLKAVDGVSFAIPTGRTLAIVGESGCGKSTVARLVAGLYRPTRGSIRIDGMDAVQAKGGAERRRIRRLLQMIFQDPMASLNPRWRVRDIIAEPIRAFGLERGAALTGHVGELLSHVGLTPADGDKFPHEFSGGQRQRISIARALSSRPRLLLCDEPTSALDVSVQAQILNLMRDLQKELGLTYLFISHNLAVVRHMADRIAVMYLGRIVENATADTLFAAPRHPYTRLLLETIPDPLKPKRDREPLAGEVPNPMSPPSGCAFHPRCPYANDRCRQERPELKRARAGAGWAEVACHGVEEARI